MNVSLPPEIETLVAEKVKSGRYASAEDVIRAGILLLDEQEARESKLDALRREIAIGMEQADRGDVAPLDIDAIKAEGRQVLARRVTSRSE